MRARPPPAELVAAPATTQAAAAKPVAAASKAAATSGTTETPKVPDPESSHGRPVAAVSKAAARITFQTPRVTDRKRRRVESATTNLGALSKSAPPAPGGSVATGSAQSIPLAEPPFPPYENIDRRTSLVIKNNGQPVAAQEFRDSRIISPRPKLLEFFRAHPPLQPEGAPAAVPQIEGMIDITEIIEKDPATACNRMQFHSDWKDENFKKLYETKTSVSR